MEKLTYIFPPEYDKALLIDVLSYLDEKTLSYVCKIDTRCKDLGISDELWMKRARNQLRYLNIPYTEIQRVFNMFKDLELDNRYICTLSYFKPRNYLDDLSKACKDDADRVYTILILADMNMHLQLRKALFINFYIPAIYLYYLRNGLENLKELLNNVDINIAENNPLFKFIDEDIKERLKQNRNDAIIKLFTTLENIDDFLPKSKHGSGYDWNRNLFLSLYHKLQNKNIEAKILLHESIDEEEDDESLYNVDSLFLAYAVCRDNNILLFNRITYADFTKYCFKACDPSWPFIDYLCNLELDDATLEELLVPSIHPRTLEKLAIIYKEKLGIKKYMRLMAKINSKVVACIFKSLLTKEDKNELHDLTICKFVDSYGKRCTTMKTKGDYCYSHTSKSRLKTEGKSKLRGRMKNED